MAKKTRAKRKRDKAARRAAELAIEKPTSVSECPVSEGPVSEARVLVTDKKPTPQTLPIHTQIGWIGVSVSILFGGWSIMNWSFGWSVTLVYVGFALPFVYLVRGKFSLAVRCVIMAAILLAASVFSMNVVFCDEPLQFVSTIEDSGTRDGVEYATIYLALTDIGGEDYHDVDFKVKPTDAYVESATQTTAIPGVVVSVGSIPVVLSAGDKIGYTLKIPDQKHPEKKSVSIVFDFARLRCTTIPRNGTIQIALSITQRKLSTLRITGQYRGKFKTHYIDVTIPAEMMPLRRAFGALGVKSCSRSWGETGGDRDGTFSVNGGHDDTRAGCSSRARGAHTAARVTRSS